MVPVFISYTYWLMVGDKAVKSRVMAVSNRPETGADIGTTLVELNETMNGMQQRAGRHVTGENET